MVNNFFTRAGGAEQYMFALAELLQAAGHDIHYFSTDKKPYRIETYPYSDYFAPFIDFPNLGLRQKVTSGWQSFYNAEAERRLTRLLKDIKPDLVHFHCIAYYLTPSVIQACKTLKIPMVMTLHDIRLMCPSGSLLRHYETHCADRRCVTGHPFHCLLNRCKYNSLSASAMVTADFCLLKMHRLYLHINAFIAPSRAVKELALQAGLPTQKVIHIPHFVDAATFTDPPDFNRDDGFFLFVGRLVKEKGLHTLIEAMQLTPEARLHIVGTGDLEAALKQRCEALQLNNVTFCGFQSGEALAEQFSHCRAVILPSISYETFGLTVMEAFRYGKPAIVSNVGALPELVQHGVNGHVFPPGDAVALSEALKIMISTPNPEHLNTSAWNTYTRWHTGQDHLNAILNLYHSVMNPLPGLT